MEIINNKKRKHSELPLHSNETGGSEMETVKHDINKKKHKSKGKRSKNQGKRKDNNVKSEGGETSSKKKKSKKHRDFATDLRSYIESWRNRAIDGCWKFNKVLQTWTLDNILSCEKINKPLFKLTCEYIMSVQGGAKERLLQQMREQIVKYETPLDANDKKESVEVEEGLQDEKEVKSEPKSNPRIAYKRAQIVLALLS